MFAGLWEQADAIAPATFTILTTEASPHLRPIHHRMPAILESDALGRWLRSGPLQGLSGDVLEADAVSSRVNSAANDGPECLTPASREGPRDLFEVTGRAIMAVPWRARPRAAGLPRATTGPSPSGHAWHDAGRPLREAGGGGDEEVPSSP